MAPKSQTDGALRVRMERRPEGTAVNTLTEHESVVLESAAGATIAKFEFTPYYHGTALLADGEIVVHSSAPGELGLVQPYHCKRDGQCAVLFEGGKVLGFDGPEALGTFHVEGAFAFVREDLRTQVQVSVPLPEAIRGVLPVEDGWVLRLSEGLAHVSRATNKVDRVSDAPVPGELLGLAGGRIVIGAGGSVALVDPVSWEVVERYVLTEKGHLHIDRMGRYSIVGDAQAVEAAVLCTDGKRAVPREACR